MRAIDRLSLIILSFAMLVIAACRLSWPVHRASIQPEQLNYRINLNTADEDTLCLLSGVGRKIAQYIVEHRETNGPFRSIAELDEVPRIGPTTIQSIAPFVTLE